MLVGDAAHAMSPAGGQGASLALEDAMVLAKRLACASGSIEQAFADVESRLRPRAERMVAQAARNDRRQLVELGGFGRWIRDRVFPLIVPAIGRQLDQQYSAVTGRPLEAA
jgi:2-polyprenyl-6-methoxyphenol hydroxylase-like FAD-dependent oxidoreductase